MNPKRIVIDGKSYNSADEMPEDVRRNYEEAMRGFKEFNAENLSGAMGDLGNIFADRNNNGTPDIFEGNQVTNLAGGTHFIVDGKSYNSLDALPPEARAKYEKAMSAMDKNQNNTPDWLEAMMGDSQQQSQPSVTLTGFPTSDTTRHASRTPLPASSVITPDTSNGWMLALAGLFLLMICALGAISVWYFFLR